MDSNQPITHIAFWNGDDFLKHQLWQTDIESVSGELIIGFVPTFDLIQLKNEGHPQYFTKLVIRSNTRTIDLVAANGGPVRC